MIRFQQPNLPFGEREKVQPVTSADSPLQSALPSAIPSIDPQKYPVPVRLDKNGELYWGVVNSELMGRRPQPLFGPAYGARAGQPVIDAAVPELERIKSGRPTALANDSVEDVLNAAIKARRTLKWPDGKGKSTPEMFANIAKAAFLARVLEFEGAQSDLKAREHS